MMTLFPLTKLVDNCRYTATLHLHLENAQPCVVTKHNDLSEKKLNSSKQSTDAKIKSFMTRGHK